MKARLRLAGTVVLLFALVAGGTFYWNPLWVNDRQIRTHLWRAGVRSEYVSVQGNRIHTFEAVPPDGTPGKPLPVSQRRLKLSSKKCAENAVRIGRNAFMSHPCYLPLKSPN